MEEAIAAPTYTTTTEAVLQEAMCLLMTIVQVFGVAMTATIQTQAHGVATIRHGTTAIQDHGVLMTLIQEETLGTVEETMEVHGEEGATTNNS